MRIKNILILVIIFALKNNIYGLIDYPWNWAISSDYGPRIRPTEGATWFHAGIDYAGSYGEEIKAVEGGEIKDITYNKGWKVEILGNGKEWLYMHMFSGSGENKMVGNYEVRNAILEDPNTHEIISNAKIIIKWSDDKTKAEKIYSKYEHRNKWVQDKIINSQQTYIQDLTGNNAITSATIEQGEAFAPVGNSGIGTGAHLHLGLNNGYDNPLFYLKHNNHLPYTASDGTSRSKTTDEKPFIITIESPIENSIISGEQLLQDYPIRVIVNSEDGVDLDKVDLWIYVGEKEDKKIHLIKSLADKYTFCYGGTTYVTEAKTSTVGETGVEPLNKAEGLDRFIYYQKFKELKQSDGSLLPSGKHKFVVIAEDVNGHTSSAQSSFYIVPSDYALYHSDTILPTPGPTGTPVAGTQYTNVVVKDLKQEPTEEPTEASGTVTPAGSAVPSPTPIPEITEVPIKDYLKGVLYGLVGDANFSDGKYI